MLNTIGLLNANFCFGSNWVQVRDLTGASSEKPTSSGFFTGGIQRGLYSKDFSLTWKRKLEEMGTDVSYDSPILSLGSQTKAATSYEDLACIIVDPTNEYALKHICWADQVLSTEETEHFVNLIKALTRLNNCESKYVNNKLCRGFGFSIGLHHESHQLSIGIEYHLEGSEYSDRFHVDLIDFERCLVDREVIEFTRINGDDVSTIHLRGYQKVSTPIIIDSDPETTDGDWQSLKDVAKVFSSTMLDVSDETFEKAFKHFITELENN